MSSGPRSAPSYPPPTCCPIHCDYAGNHSIYTDKKLLKNILINLLGNAIKFSGEGTSIYLEVMPLPDGGMAISVRDQKIRIGAEDKKYLFSIFATAPS